MAFNQFSNRGMFLETLINQTAWYYEQQGHCIIFKRSVPVSIYKNEDNVVCAKVISKSGSDYYGIYKGRMIDFEAKQTTNNYFLLSNIKSHQWDHLIKIQKFNGISFIVLHLLTEDSYYVIDIDKIIEYRNTTKLTLEWIHSNGFKIELVFPGILDLEKYLENKIK